MLLCLCPQTLFFKTNLRLHVTIVLLTPTQFFRHIFIQSVICSTNGKRQLRSELVCQRRFRMRPLDRRVSVLTSVQAPFFVCFVVFCLLPALRRFLLLCRFPAKSSKSDEIGAGQQFEASRGFLPHSIGHLLLLLQRLGWKYTKICVNDADRSNQFSTVKVCICSSLLEWSATLALLTYFWKCISYGMVLPGPT